MKMKKMNKNIVFGTICIILALAILSYSTLQANAFSITTKYSIEKPKKYWVYLPYVSSFMTGNLTNYPNCTYDHYNGKIYAVKNSTFFTTIQYNPKCKYIKIQIELSLSFNTSVAVMYTIRNENNTIIGFFKTSDEMYDFTKYQGVEGIIIENISSTLEINETINTTNAGKIMFGRRTLIEINILNSTSNTTEISVIGYSVTAIMVLEIPKPPVIDYTYPVILGITGGTGGGIAIYSHIRRRKKT